jgi:hypothetical protein
MMTCSVSVHSSRLRILLRKTGGEISTWLGDFAACLGTAGHSVSQYNVGGQQFLDGLVRIRFLAHKSILEVALIRV